MCIALSPFLTPRTCPTGLGLYTFLSIISLGCTKYPLLDHNDQNVNKISVLINFQASAQDKEIQKPVKAMAPLRQSTIMVNNSMALGLSGLAPVNQRYSTNIRIESGGMSPPRIVEEDQILIRYDEKKQIPIIIQDTLTVSFL